MAGRRRLKCGAPRLLGYHGGAPGRAYGRAYKALAAEYGPFERGTLLALEAGRVAAAWVNLEAATVALTEARRSRVTGKGRRPNERAIERLARRQGLADQSYSQALDRLREMATATKKGADLAKALAAHQGGAL